MTDGELEFAMSLFRSSLCFSHPPIQHMKIRRWSVASRSTVSEMVSPWSSSTAAKKEDSTWTCYQVVVEEEVQDDRRRTGLRNVS
jgi:hypothetical protein